jgi:ribosome-binding protein aMBF1 (putative translation factor)
MAEEHPLRVWRDAQSPKLSQEALGLKLGVDGLTISRWERHDTEPQKRQWEKIEEITGLTRAQFLGFEASEAAE